MSRVVPSQVVDLIDKLFPWAKDQKENDGKNYLSAGNSCSIAAVIDLTQQIPSELITLLPDDFTEFVSSTAALRTSIQNWQFSGDSALHFIPGLRPLSPVTLIRQNLAKCPDEFPAASTAELTFITDIALQQSLRLDLSASNNALSNGEWKAAIVLAGSLVEALLLLALLQQNQVNVLAAAARVSLKVSSNLEDWVLYQYIEVAAELKLIAAETATQCRLAKDFRNLIHPGQAQRLEQACNRGTALSAVAAVEHVVNDLTT